ncbi:uncharacterized protein [Anas platyrhynchos]|uniref:uncharacterized protein isoform X2 n=1 Tax=Anas platyrhynchos TaxID=8839 RepID=UPI003AF24A90
MTQEDTFPAQPSWAERHGQYRALRPQPLRKAANSECITLHEMSVFPNMLMLLFFQSTAPNWRMPRVGPLLQPGAGHKKNLPAVQGNKVLEGSDGEDLACSLREPLPVPREEEEEELRSSQGRVMLEELAPGPALCLKEDTQGRAPAPACTAACLRQPDSDHGLLQSCTRRTLQLEEVLKPAPSMPPLWNHRHCSTGT